MKRIIEISTVYSRRGVCRVKVWDSWSCKTVSARAGGYGYDKESAAVADALNGMGVKLGAVASFGWNSERQQFATGGVGMGSLLDALRADGFTVYESHPTDDVAVYIAVREG